MNSGQLFNDLNSLSLEVPMPNSIDSIIEKQNAFFKKGFTLDLKSRKERLQKLLEATNRFQEEIAEALLNDLGKSYEEALLTEIREVKKEISYTLKHVSKWAKIKKVSTPLTLFGSKSFIQPEPFGKILIISPWNYPFNLSIMPLIAAIASGNTGVIKPSELAPNTSSVIFKMISETFMEDEIAVIQGAVKETTELLDKKFEYIFFTGGENVGKIIMGSAAKHLTPLTLELGGKSPVIVCKDADIKTAAKRIAWAKFTNAGQTCVAPDYVLIDQSVKNEFYNHIKENILSFYGNDPKKSSFYGRIINERHFKRLRELLKNQKSITMVETDEDKRFISPVVLDEPEAESPVMKEEIFGPVLPVLSFNEISEAIDFITIRPKPLALYAFTEDKSISQMIMEKTSSGGVCINDALVHLSSHNLPFGGVGTSGMGSYHGEFGFRTFSHYKAIVSTTTKFDLPLRYPPFPKWFGRLMNII